MSDFDDDSDEDIADALETLNCELVRAGKIHAADDAIMIQAYKRLRRRSNDRTKAKGLNIIQT